MSNLDREQSYWTKIAEANEKLIDERLPDYEAYEIKNRVNENILEMAGDDEQFFITHAINLVYTRFGPRIMTDQEKERYFKEHTPQKLLNR